jgi:hypothetical protein
LLCQFLRLPGIAEVVGAQTKSPQGA